MIVRLNVGGTRYDTSRDTLGRCEGSKLAKSVSDSWEEGDEPIFIDRNGRLFEYVLDYLRTGEVHLPFTVSRAALQNEFHYYGIKADLRKWHQSCGTEYIDLFLEKAEARRMDKLVTQTAAFVEQEFLKYSNAGVSIPQADYVQLCQHEELLRARLFERGLELQRRDWRYGQYLPIIYVAKLDKERW